VLSHEADSLLGTAVEALDALRDFQTQIVSCSLSRGAKCKVAGQFPVSGFVFGLRLPYFCKNTRVL
jgi:hypothetical protein